MSLQQRVPSIQSLITTSKTGQIPISNPMHPRSTNLLSLNPPPVNTERDPNCTIVSRTHNGASSKHCFNASNTCNGLTVKSSKTTSGTSGFVIGSISKSTSSSSSSAFFSSFF